MEIYQEQENFIIQMVIFQVITKLNLVKGIVNMIKMVINNGKLNLITMQQQQKW